MDSSCLPLFRYNTHYLILHVYTQSKILKAQISLGCHKLLSLHMCIISLSVYYSQDQSLFRAGMEWSWAECYVLLTRPHP